MDNVLVTGAAGFIGRNLVTVLQRLDNSAGPEAPDMPSAFVEKVYAI